MARGQTALTQNTVETILSGGSAYSGRRMSRGIIKNIGSGTVYLQWTAETVELSTSNGFPLDAGEILGIDLERTGSKSSQLVADVKAVTSLTSQKLAWAFE